MTDPDALQPSGTVDRHLHVAVSGDEAAGVGVGDLGGGSGPD